MEKPLPGNSIDVTCIVPTHGRDGDLLRAIESILKQTSQPASIVIVDDLGTGELRHAIREIIALDDRIVYLPRAGARAGASASRNAGAEMASTQYLAFLDDDDEWDQDYLVSMVGLMKEQRTTLAVSWGRLRQEGRVKHNNWRMPPQISARAAAGANPGFTGSNFIVTRDRFNSIGGFDEDQRVFNDLDLLVRLLSQDAKYSVLARDAVTQHATGAGHLSSRSNARAVSILRFIHKHGELLTASARRRYIRAAHVARVSTENPRARRYVNAVIAIAYSSPTDSLRAIMRRVKDEPRY